MLRKQRLVKEHIMERKKLNKEQFDILEKKLHVQYGPAMRMLAAGEENEAMKIAKECEEAVIEKE